MNQGKTALEAWLQQVESGTEAVPGGSFLPGIGQAASHRARREDDLEWANIAVRVYELSSRAGDSERDSVLRKAMNLRAWFICKRGSTPGDPVLDRDIILRWFYKELRYSFDEVLRLIAAWKQTGLPLSERLALNDLRELRAIKNRLDPVRQLFDCGGSPDDSDLQRWLDVRDQLP